VGGALVEGDAGEAQERPAPQAGELSSPDPVLHLLAGPNGAGKSTLATRVLQPVTHLPFVNADLIAAERWPGAELAHAYEASRAAAAVRTELIAARRSFLTETVFSHPSKLELVAAAQRAGYLVTLHVVLLPVEVTLARVAFRVGRGGHEVPEAKVRERYDRLWPLVAQARELAERTRVYDNGSAATPFRLVADYEHGELLGRASYPRWAPAELVPPGIRRR
jgi:predicted ABC-type ATPase